MSNKVDEITRRTYRYYYEDGLVEMAIGGLFTLLGLGLWIFDRALSGSSLGWLLGLGLPAVIIAGVFGVKWAILALKQQVTYPRTGAVTYKDQPTMGRWWFVAVLAVFVFISFFLPESFNTAAVMAGFLLALILFYMGTRVSLFRMQAAAILPLAAGIFSGYAGLGELMGNVVVFGLTGLELFLLGAFALTRYLRENPPGGEESE